MLPRMPTTQDTLLVGHLSSTGARPTNPSLPSVCNFATTLFSHSAGITAATAHHVATLLAPHRVQRWCFERRALRRGECLFCQRTRAVVAEIVTCCHLSPLRRLSFAGWTKSDCEKSLRPERLYLELCEHGAPVAPFVDEILSENLRSTCPGFEDFWAMVCCN